MKCPVRWLNETGYSVEDLVKSPTFFEVSSGRRLPATMAFRPRLQSG